MKTGAHEVIDLLLYKEEYADYEEQLEVLALTVILVSLDYEVSTQ